MAEARSVVIHHGGNIYTVGIGRHCKPVVLPLGHALPDSIKHMEDMYRDQDPSQQGSALVLQEIAR